MIRGEGDQSPAGEGRRSGWWLAGDDERGSADRGSREVGEARRREAREDRGDGTNRFDNFSALRFRRRIAPRECELFVRRMLPSIALGQSERNAV